MWNNIIIIIANAILASKLVMNIEFGLSITGQSVIILYSQMYIDSLDSHRVYNYVVSKYD